MSTKHRIEQGVRLPDPDFVHPEVVAPETRAGKAFRYVAAALRLSLGCVLLGVPRQDLRPGVRDAT